MKNSREFDVGKSDVAKKVVLRMKLIVCILVLGFSTAWAEVNAQIKLNLTLKNATLAEVFEEITRQTGYYFAYSDNLLEGKGRVDVKAENEDLSEVLKACLQKSGLGFRLEGNVILVSDKYFELPQPNKREVRGIVTDKDRQPLPGVTVLVKGTTQGVATHVDGAYGIVLPQGVEVTLVFSFVGMKTQEIKVSDNEKVINVVMEADMEDLQEVVVTGYSILPKERATGSINVISQRQLDKPATNFASRLIGTTAGLASTLDAEGNPTFEIRGQTSLYANAQPLLVVDGFPVEGGFNSINPNDVASVTVLKDAAAASIWGARAANGVIVVTTKKADSGDRLKVELSGFVKVSPKLDLDYVNPLASSSETVDYEMKAFNKWGAIFNNGNLMNDYSKAYSQALTALNENYLGNLTEDEMNAILNRLRTQDNRDQIRKYMLAVPVSQQYNVSISNASQRASNLLSLMFMDKQSQFKETGSQEYMLNYRNTSQLAKWLDFNASVMFRYAKEQNDGCSLSDIQNLSPYDMLKNEDGSYTNVVNDYYQPIIDDQVPTELFPYSDWSYNPIVEMNNRDLTDETLNIRLQAGLSVKLMKGLTYDGKFQYELLQEDSKSRYMEDSYYVRNLVNTSSTWDKNNNTVTQNVSSGDVLTERRVRTVGYNLRNQLNYSGRFNHHEIDVLVGTEISNRVINGTDYPTVYGYDDEKLTVGALLNGVTVTNWMNSIYTFDYQTRFSESTARYFSLYGNAAYTFDGKYTLSGSIRTDASNLITDDPSYRYSPFWSLGLRWQMYREHFLQSVSWLDRLTLRLTYGFNGNVDSSTSFIPLISMESTPDIYTDEITATIASFGNPTLRWEKVGTLNVGFDYSLFEGKLSGKLDVYRKAGKDLLAEISIPSLHGTTSQKFNNARMLNTGVELEVGTAMQFGEVEWWGSLNFAYNKNKITELYRQNYYASDLAYGGTAAYVEGKNAQTLWAYDYAGVYNVGTKESPDLQPMIEGPEGRFTFADGTPGGNATTYMLDMGTLVAPYTMGFSSYFTYRNLDFSFILTGKFGHVFKHHSFNYPNLNGKALPNARYDEVLNCDPMEMLPLPQNETEQSYGFWGAYYPFLDYLTDKANHVRLQEVNLTYRFPSKWFGNSGLKNLQIYGQANNLFVIKNNKYGEDPETPLGTLRLQPQYTFGFKLEF